jgi:DNA-directed RNA polymerase subunit RPC12/RpoP
VAILSKKNKTVKTIKKTYHTFSNRRGGKIMGLESMMIYSCPICGNAMAGMEWEDSPDTAIGSTKDICCPSCGGGLNEDELIGEE